MLVQIGRSAGHNQMSRFSKVYLENTIKVWQPHYSKVLTLEDARVIAENVIGYFELLIDWKTKREKGEQKCISS